MAIKTLDKVAVSKQLPEADEKVISPLGLQFKAARRCGTPLIAVQTPDQFATMSRLV
jgi:hypothetical protein